jgi:hypothetical protein
MAEKKKDQIVIELYRDSRGLFSIINTLSSENGAPQQSKTENGKPLAKEDLNRITLNKLQ